MKSASWRQVTPYRIEFRQGGGWLSVFGLPFFAAGIFMWLSLAGIVPARGLDSSAITWVALPLAALASTGVGATLVFGRVWTSIDRAEGTLEQQWGLLVAMHTKTTRLGGCLAVVIGFNPGDSDSADTFPLTLKSSIGHPKIFTASTYAEARECATSIARLLNVEVEDETSDHAVRVVASKGVLSLSERLRQEGPDQGTIPRPSNIRSEVRVEGNGVRITIPSGPVHPFMIAATVVPFAIIVAVFGPVLGLFWKTKTSDPFAGIVFGPLIVLFAAIPVMSLVNTIVRARRGATIVTVSTDGIRIDERGAWRTRTTGAYAPADVFDIDYSTTESTMASARRTAVAIARESDGMAQPPTAVSPGMERVLTRIVAFARTSGITLKTRKGLVKFGAGLDDGEIRYLYAQIRRALVGSPRL